MPSSGQRRQRPGAYLMSGREAFAGLAFERGARLVGLVCASHPATEAVLTPPSPILAHVSQVMTELIAARDWLTVCQLPRTRTN
jgi:hypothetical protein